VLLLCALAAGAMLATASPATAASECDRVSARLKDRIAALVPATGPPAAGSAAAKRLNDESIAAFRAELTAHPSCQDELAVLGRQLTGIQRETPHGTPFLGPIGWLWNKIYYSIFQGSTVLMVMFGWELFLSPFILVFCIIAVFRGTSGLLKKPYVPPELRTNEQ
jgi:hypothetical protein